ncbi:MAG: subclass B3 metallo-beta-lactamase [Pseudolabrys sp.]|jgi:metallo-beta-lactamase class B|nr:subclass B3 metallo-beta-lactamase [Pseudolabrys sp.]
MRFILVVLQLILAGAAVGQDALPPSLSDIGTALSGQQRVPPTLGAYLKSWVEPTEPFKVVGPIHYVGTKGLAAYLITTPAGHILLDGGMPGSAEVIEESIHKLGFDPRDIKLVLITHAHIDHAGTMAHFVQLSGGSAAVMDRDFEQLKSGGKTDPVYGKQPAFQFPPVAAERVLKDWDVLTLGNIKMTALLGAGHTRGATTWVTTVEDGGRTYNVVFPCCTGVNPGYRLLRRPSYPGIADDYRRTFRMLESMKPDIWLPAHTQTPGFAEKFVHRAEDGVQGWVDPQGYRRWLADEKAKFEAAVALEK